VVNIDNGFGAASAALRILHGNAEDIAAKESPKPAAKKKKKAARKRKAR